jgi:hypothetical protein
MKTVADPRVLQSLVARLRAVRPDGERRWGTLTPHEMLCHLGDATDMVLGIRPRKQPVLLRRRTLAKLVWLWSPLPWPHGVPTNPSHDPRVDGTRPSDFAKDLGRAIEGIESIATVPGGCREPAHGFFGEMSLRDWQRWAYRHTDHHLRQFGL